MNNLNNSLDGWLIINKDIGVTSRHVVNIIKKTLNVKKVGHAGTLDPFASGVLAIAIGKATKTVNFVMDGVKKYEFTIKWGTSTDSHDIEGKITSISKEIPNDNNIKSILDNFKGNILQKPPRFSAIKVNGIRAYNLAREGKKFSLKSRMVFLKSIKLNDNINKNNKNLSNFEVECGKGFYIRSLVRDICQKLNVDGHTIKLKRVESNPFKITGSVTIDKFLYLYKKNDWKKLFLPIYSVLNKLKYVGE